MAFVGTCSVPGCDRKEFARHWCYRHYTSNRKYGDPLFVDSEENKIRRSAASVRKPTRYWLGKKRPALSMETRAKMSASHLAKKYSGRAHHRFGKTPAHIKRIEYRGISFRSGYEVRFAKFLDDAGVEWQYEPRRFDLVESTYLPDFYLPEYRSYYEVKGWLDARAERKLDLFRELYPEIPLILVPKPFFKQLETH